MSLHDVRERVPSCEQAKENIYMQRKRMGNQSEAAGRRQNKGIMMIEQNGDDVYSTVRLVNATTVPMHVGDSLNEACMSGTSVCGPMVAMKTRGNGTSRCGWINACPCLASRTRVSARSD